MIRVAIVEDIDDIREGLTFILQSEKEFECKNVFANAEDAYAKLLKNPVDVVLMDIHLPGMSGIECIAKLNKKKSEMQYIICTVYEDDENIFNAIKAGATGYLLKKTPGEKIIEAIKEILNGGSPMSAPIARKVIQSFQKPADNTEINLLSKREQELLQLLDKGFRYKEIAEKLFLSIETVRTHIRNIYQKLQVQSRTEALNKAYKR